MDLTRIPSPHDVGEYVRVDYGNWQSLKPEHEAINGKIAEVIGHDVHGRFEYWDECVEKSINILQFKDGKIVREHWMNTRRVTPLEALANQTE